MGFFDNLFGRKKNKGISKNYADMVEAQRHDFESVGLVDLFNKIKPLARIGVEINSEIKSDNKIKLAMSKWNGLPDLPKDMQWPVDAEGNPLLFIGQINLQEVVEYDVEGLLPKNGLLSFFITQNESFSGYKPSDKSRFKVLYTEDFSNLERKPLPDGLFPDSDTKLMSFDSFVYYPVTYSDQFPDYELDEEETDRYTDLTTTQEHMLGYPRQIQDSMECSCELIRQGFNLEETEVDYEDESLFLHKDDWIPLLECEMEENLCDSSIFFWIRKQDLANKDFDKVLCLLQCT